MTAVYRKCTVVSVQSTTSELDILDQTTSSEINISQDHTATAVTAAPPATAAPPVTVATKVPSATAQAGATPYLFQPQAPYFQWPVPGTSITSNRKHPNLPQKFINSAATGEYVNLGKLLFATETAPYLSEPENDVAKKPSRLITSFYSWFKA